MFSSLQVGECEELHQRSRRLTYSGHRAPHSTRMSRWLTQRPARTTMSFRFCCHGPTARTVEMSSLARLAVVAPQLHLSSRCWISSSARAIVPPQRNPTTEIPSHASIAVHTRQFSTWHSRFYPLTLARRQLGPILKVMDNPALSGSRGFMTLNVI